MLCVVCVLLSSRREAERRKSGGAKCWVVEAAACLREQPLCCEGKVRWTEGWRGGLWV